MSLVSVLTIVPFLPVLHLCSASMFLSIRVRATEFSFLDLQPSAILLLMPFLSFFLSFLKLSEAPNIHLCKHRDEVYLTLEVQERESP